MKPPRCRLCETAHWNNEPHVFATNGEESATNAATNKVASTKGGEADAAAVSAVHEVAGVASAKTRNGRARSAYNAYQLDYMKKRRAEKILKISGEKS